MIRTVLFLVGTFLMPSCDADAQLNVRQAVHLGTWTMTSTAAHDCDNRLGAFRCAEVAAAFAASPGATYHTSVSATPLTNGPHVVEWTPYILCPRSSVRTTTCVQSAKSPELFWQIGGRVAQVEEPQPGLYKSAALFTVDGPEGVQTARIAATFLVENAQNSCRLSSSGNVDFGKGEAWRPGTITLDPVTGTRSYSGGQKDGPILSSYSLATIRVSTASESATVSVYSPGQLQAAMNTVSFTSLLAYLPPERRDYELLLAGPGSRSVNIGTSGSLELRLGGTVKTSSLTEASTYGRSIQIGVVCAQYR